MKKAKNRVVLEWKGDFFGPFFFTGIPARYLRFGIVGVNVVLFLDNDTIDKGFHDVVIGWRSKATDKAGGQFAGEWERIVEYRSVRVSPALSSVLTPEAWEDWKRRNLEKGK